MQDSGSSFFYLKKNTLTMVASEPPPTKDFKKNYLHLMILKTQGMRSMRIILPALPTGNTWTGNRWR